MVNSNEIILKTIRLFVSIFFDDSNLKIFLFNKYAIEM